MALYLSLILKIPVIGEKPSRTSGTKIERNNLRRLRMCEVLIVKNTDGLKSAKLSLIEKMFKLVDAWYELHLDSTSLFIENYVDFEDM